MRLKINVNKNGTRNFYVIQSYRNLEGKSTTKTVKKLGTDTEIAKLHGDPDKWAAEYVEKLNKELDEGKTKINIELDSASRIESGKVRTLNGGYLFAQKIYYDLKLDYICRRISSKYQSEYSLNDVLKMLVFGRILFPNSKCGTYEQCSNLLEKPSFELHDIYRALEVIADETNTIQSSLYKTSKSLGKRNDKVLYYDCTNFYFEIEHESGIRQYGISKEHRPNPIVQMGLFMDGDGIPLAFSISSGNTNEQTTLQPLEKQIIEEFGHDKFVVCTDAGLSSAANRKFNDKLNRSFITTQSIKKLKTGLKDWALDRAGWKLPGSAKDYNIDEILCDDILRAKLYDKIFYKEQWINEGGIEQRIIVSYSLKYASYTEKIRNEQISRARNAVANNFTDKYKENDYKRFIKKIAVTNDGECASKKEYLIDDDKISEEAKYDGLYAVATNLEDNVSDILKVNKGRWEIEECFRIMKTEFKSRPVYLSNDNRIKAHFTTCYLALTVFRYLEKKLGEKYSPAEIIENLKNMNFMYFDSAGYVPTYTRNEFTDNIHSAFGFNTDTEIIPKQTMKKFIASSKNR